MTSHWNLPPPASSNPPHSGVVGPKRVSSSNSIGVSYTKQVKIILLSFPFSLS